MVTVAVAGGTTGIGSNVVRGIRDSGKHDLVVLSRSKRPELEEQGVTVRVVDYESPDQLKEALQGVHTVISCIWSFGPDFALSQLALLEAAKAVGAKRFVPSDWATDKYESVAGYAGKITVWDAVQKSGLEYTRFIPGLWMNEWAVGATRSPNEALAGYRGPPFLLDLKKRTLLIPGDGNQKAVFTDMRDIGKIVAASLDLPSWQPDTRIVGERLTYNEVAKITEKAIGHTIEKTYYPMSAIEGVLAGNPDPEQFFFHQFMKMIADGAVDFEPTANAAVTSVKPIQAEAYLTEAWSGFE
ncbi:NAD(P)-binding protein [Trichoderma velutinum]